MPGCLATQVLADGEGRADVEIEGTDELDGARQPVDLAGTEDENPRPTVHGAVAAGIDGLAILQESRQSEEQGANEKGDRVGAYPDPAGVTGHGPQGKEG
jgi:hypothetical protein